MNKILRQIINIVACGLILTYLAVASSNIFINFAPLPVSEGVFYGACLVFGFYMGVLLEEFSTIFYSVALMAGITGVAFGAVMTRVVMFNNPLLDVALLFAFQQTLPRLIFIAILSYVGVFFAGLQRMVSGRL